MPTALCCERCGAPLPAEAVTVSVSCGYCGTTSVPAPQVVERVVQRIVVQQVDARGRELHAGESSALRCPRCAEAFHSTQSGEHTLFACRNCGGVFLDAVCVALLTRRADEAILYAASRAVRALAPYPNNRRGALCCPVCRVNLARADLGETGHSVDSCTTHGTFFDRGEVQAFADYHRELRAGDISAEDLSAAGLPGRGWFGN